MPSTGFPVDLIDFFNWKNFIYQYGVGNVFYSGANYPPAYYYILKLHTILFGNAESHENFNSNIKLYTLAFDLSGIGLVLNAVGKKKDEILHWSLLALNISYLYNTILWGQVDGIASALNFASILFLYKKQWTLAGIFFIISFNFKIQAIIFLPLIILLIIVNYKSALRKEKILALISVLAVQILLILPFLHIGKLKQLISIFTSAVGFYPLISLNAANSWCWIFPSNIYLATINDTDIFLGLTWKSWGFILFSTVMLFTFFPLLKKLYFQFTRKISFDLNFDQIMLTGAIFPLAIFYFSTEMHERYSHNAWLFIAAWSFNNKKYFPLLLFSMAYFLNMEAVLKSIHFSNESIIWNFRFISVLYFILISYLIYQMWHSLKLPTQNAIELKPEPSVSN